jgi:hypothetical protein
MKHQDAVVNIRTRNGDAAEHSHPTMLPPALRRYYLQEADVRAFGNGTTQESSPVRLRNSAGSGRRKRAVAAVMHIGPLNLTDSPSRPAAPRLSMVETGLARLFRPRASDAGAWASRPSSFRKRTLFPSLSAADPSHESPSLIHVQPREDANQDDDVLSLSSHSTSSMDFSWHVSPAISSPASPTLKRPTIGRLNSDRSSNRWDRGLLLKQPKSQRQNGSPSTRHLDRIVQKFEQTTLVSFPPIYAPPKSESAALFANSWMHSSVEDLSHHLGSSLEWDAANSPTSTCVSSTRSTTASVA